MLQYPGHKGEKDPSVPALLRIKLWLGLQAQEEAWHMMQKEGELAVFAETVSCYVGPVCFELIRDKFNVLVKKVLSWVL